MHLDLRQSAAALRKHIAQRARNYAKRSNKGPGKPGDPVTQITIGYQFDQAGWFALVFDTRPEAECDGKWNSFIKPNAVKIPAWNKAFSSLSKDESLLQLTKHNGQTKTLGATTDDEEFAKYIGVAIRDVLIEARKKGAFAGVPLAKKCGLTVEEHDGHYGWTTAPRGEKEAKKAKAQLKQVAGNVAAKTRKEQITHWIAVLDGIASGPKKKDAWRLIFEVLGKLERFGNEGIVPLLEFVKKWSGEPEWTGDRPKCDTTAMSEPCRDVLWTNVLDSNAKTAEVEALLCEIFSRSVKANSGRRLWGRIPTAAAMCLHSLFGTYPEPEQNRSTFAILNHKAFLKPSRPSRSKSAKKR